MLLDIIYELDGNVGKGRCPVKYLHPLERRREIMDFPSVPRVKYYAIKYGYDRELANKVFNWIAYSWEECRYYTQGVSCAVFKSFNTLDDAKKYLGI